eukprot:3431621-Lingulodinium_polyedra.AAC.1
MMLQLLLNAPAPLSAPAPLRAPAQLPSPPKPLNMWPIWVKTRFLMQECVSCDLASAARPPDPKQPRGA